VNVEPMQLAGLMLEKTTDQLGEDEVNDLALKRRSPSVAWSGRWLQPVKPAGKVLRHQNRRGLGY